MPSYNKVILMGHLTRDIELKYLPSGTAVGTFSLAVNRSWKTEDGEKKDEVSFFDCVVFGKRAETMAEYLKKGAAVHTEGRLKQDTWEDKESGKNRSKVKVIVESFTFIGGSKKDKDEEDGPADEPPRQFAKATKEHAAAAVPADDPDDDVPF